MGATATDSENAATTDSNAVVITGNARYPLDAEDWYRQFRGRGDMSPATLACYLKIVNYMSGVFGHAVNLTTSADVLQVFHPTEFAFPGDPHRLLDRGLLVAWLNFANGAYDWNSLLDTTGNDRLPGTPFSLVMDAAERVRLNPAATWRQILTQLWILQAIQEDWPEDRR
jgi:hypothetical protein